MNEEKKESKVELPGIPEPLNPKFAQKAIRTYERDLAAALGKDAKDKGVEIRMESPADKAKKEMEARKVAQKEKADAELRARIEKSIGPENYVKPIEAFDDVEPSKMPPPEEKLAVPVEKPPEIKPIPPQVPPLSFKPEPRPEPKPEPKPFIPPLIPKPIIPKEVPQKTETIKTLQTDVAEMVKTNKASAISIAVAENKKKQQEKREIENDSIQRKHGIAKVFITLLCLILVGGGIAGFYYFYSKSPLAAPPVIPTEITTDSIIPVDAQSYIHADGMSNKQVISNIYSIYENDKLEPGKLLEIIPKETKNGEENPMTGSYFISRMGINVPNILFRSLTDRWLLGVYTEETGQKTPVIALTTDFFQNAFAGMLGWEKTMPDDLSTILGYEQEAYLDSVSEASSTPSSYFTIRGQFSDRQLRNRDVREFTNTKGELLFLYSFIDKETILITTSESSFISIIDRIEKRGYVR